MAVQTKRRIEYKDGRIEHRKENEHPGTDVVAPNPESDVQCCDQADDALNDEISFSPLLNFKTERTS